jgi:two-component system, HptB-dependent secretion and biofilm response regulator
MQNSSRDTEVLSYLKTLTLLCVEDNKTTQQLYKILFEELVNEVIFADNGIEGYQKYFNNHIDIIISDYEMPQSNGIEFIQKIREEDKTIPIIFASAIENVDIVIKALHYDVNSFVKKPICNDELLNAVQSCAKILIANQVLKQEKEKAEYTSYQEELGFAKELNILRNDFYYKMVSYESCINLVDFLYSPLDVLSGDAYSARHIDAKSTFYLMVDGMGKGVSASLTAMLMTSFVNYTIDKMLVFKNFDLNILIDESMKYIQAILLEEETLSIDFILSKNKENKLYYAKFAMPVLLMQDNKKSIIKIKSNNPPLSKWQTTFKIDSIDVSNIQKMLIYSDGVVENETIYENKPYSEFIEEDFLQSFTREDLKNSFYEKITEQEDDISLIYIQKLVPNSEDIANAVFDSTMEAVDKANGWYEDIWSSITNETEVAYHAGVVFSELFMNAYEHGNLGIDRSLKHNLLESDAYFETLAKKEKTCTKKIEVQIKKLIHGDTLYIVTYIIDEGDGFDTMELSQIFRNSKTFNGRGVFVSRKNSLGIYYNSKGNAVLYLNKVEKS